MIDRRNSPPPRMRPRAYVQAPAAKRRAASPDYAREGR